MVKAPKPRRSDRCRNSLHVEPTLVAPETVVEQCHEDKPTRSLSSAVPTPAQARSAAVTILERLHPSGFSAQAAGWLEDFG